MAVNLNEQRKAGLFKHLVNHSLYDTGIEFGFDKHYKDPTAVKNAVYRVYREVAMEIENDLEGNKYSMGADILELVKTAVSGRSVATAPKVTLIEKKGEGDIKELALSTRDQAASLLFRKMDMIASSRKKLNDVSLSVLATTFGILFDKAQIIQGQATENVAVLARIDKEMTAEESLDFILKVREINVGEKAK